MLHQPHNEIGSNILILCSTCRPTWSSCSCISALALLLSYCGFLSLMHETGLGKCRAVEYWGSCSWNCAVMPTIYCFCCKLQSPVTVLLLQPIITALHEISVNDGIRLLDPNNLRDQLPQQSTLWIWSSLQFTGFNPILYYFHVILAHFIPIFSVVSKQYSRKKKNLCIPTPTLLKILLQHLGLTHGQFTGFEMKFMIAVAYFVIDTNVHKFELNFSTMDGIIMATKLSP